MKGGTKPPSSFKNNAMNQESNISFIMKHKESAKLEEYKDLKIVTCTTSVRDTKRPAMSAWKGKQKNPISNYYYMSEKSRQEAIDRLKEAADSRQEYKKQKAAERKAFTPEFEVGDIFCTSWGYEQTNREFYQVVEKPSAHYAIIREIAQEQVDGSHGHDCCDVVGVKDKFITEETERRKVGRYGISFSSYRSASKWDGTPMYKSWYY